MSNRVSLVRLISGGQVLELQPSPSERRQRAWDLPGGHAEEGETPDYTAARELKEETGISVRPSSLSMVKTFRREDGKLFYIFEFRTVGQPPVRLSNEHVGYRWRPDDASAFGRS